MIFFKILRETYPLDLKGKSNGELLKAITENEPRLPSEITNYQIQISRNEKASDESVKGLMPEVERVNKILAEKNRLK